MVKKAEKKQKKYGKHYNCPSCGQRVYETDEEFFDNLSITSGIKSYSCPCGEDFLI